MVAYRPYGGILQRSRVARNAEIPSALLRPLQATTDRATRHRRLRVVVGRSPGLITERTASGAERPLAAQVGAWVDTGGCLLLYVGERASNIRRGRRYELTALPESARVIVRCTQGYFQQCAAPPVQMTADVAVDVEMVPRALVSASPDSVTNKPGFRSISGVIYENTPSGRLPVPGVFVAYEHTDSSSAPPP